jgi:hypothetical protein
MALPALGLGFAPGMTMAAKAARIGIAIAIVAALLLLSYCQGRTDGKNAEKVEQQAATIKAQARDKVATDTAASERTTDQAANRDLTEAYNDEIAKAPAGTRNSAPATNLACERLRRAGRDTRSIPACGGR